MRNGRNKSKGKGPVSNRQFQAMSERCLTLEINATLFRNLVASGVEYVRYSDDGGVAIIDREVWNGLVSVAAANQRPQG